MRQVSPPELTLNWTCHADGECVVVAGSTHTSVREVSYLLKKWSPHLGESQYSRRKWESYPRDESFPRGKHLSRGGA